ncbi:outer membrane porin, OprD family [Pseudomonas alloputida]|uniref:Porin, putative n=3 Tax=Pseudomonas TaxID=286 RepID=I7BGV5_PSEPT|nr:MULTISPECIES: OprD family porin [Pseudomonas]AFO51003.1 porin, putative [Pseudomonas putida DOT-T1E]MCX2705018.1 OprD family porin [Pseudomonas sp. DCB_BG]NWL45257.1 outer membrane porin, OprD family [Pseudomonas hunanensis]PTV68046.1 outer membrane porin, OprD family [Pseudomonas putida]TRZ61845.1 outer membrane porin, OprD family [Pseudomonas alloputida]
MIVIFRRASLVLSALYCACQTAQAAFIHDGSGNLELRNFYFDRDFHGDSATQSRRSEWAQGFMLRLQSGYTDGVVGFGLDAAGMLGLKLDSSPDRSGSGLLPRGSDKRAADDYAKAVATFKARLAQSELKAGGLSPQLPLLASNSSRLFPQWFNGVQLVSKDLDRFTFTLLQVNATKLRDSTDYEDLTAMAQQGAYLATVTSDRLRYAGVDYQPLNNLTLSLHTSVLEDLFRRDFAGFKFKTRLGPGDVFTEWRWFNAREQGRALLGGVDNQTLSTNFGYSVQGHTFSGGYQKVRGDTAYAYVGGTDTYLFSEQQVSTFALANERAWMLRYDFNFAAVGIPGLTFNVRYVKGDQVDPQRIASVKGRTLAAGGGEGREWERTTDITYVVQSGALRNVSLRWRNASMRSNFADAADENRVIVGYTFEF